MSTTPLKVEPAGDAIRVTVANATLTLTTDEAFSLAQALLRAPALLEGMPHQEVEVAAGPARIAVTRRMPGGLTYVAATSTGPKAAWATLVDVARYATVDALTAQIAAAVCAEAEAGAR